MSKTVISVSGMIQQIIVAHPEPYSSVCVRNQLYATLNKTTTYYKVAFYMYLNHSYEASHLPLLTLTGKKEPSMWGSSTEHMEGTYGWNQ